MSEYFIKLFCGICEKETLHHHKNGIFTCPECGREKDLGDVLQGIDERAVREKCRLWKKFEEAREK